MLFADRKRQTFADGTTASGMGNSPVKVLGSIAADFDGDGRIDLFVANDAMDNYLWAQPRRRDLRGE
ncbi:MAG: hypothetical protein R2862_02270 [Thermoanaerobaculia bacterium]